MIIHKIVLLIVSTTMILAADPEEKQREATDINAFLVMSNKISLVRKERLITIDQFNEMSRDMNTVIIDSRSKKAFEDAHIKGAINLNFSDFTADKLLEVIPNKDTRILIYCNNNFISKRRSLLDKSLPLALNIPTFINLYGYGYKNVYELEDRIPDIDDRVNLVIKTKKENNTQ